MGIILAGWVLAPSLMGTPFWPWLEVHALPSIHWFGCLGIHFCHSEGVVGGPGTCSIWRHIAFGLHYSPTCQECRARHDPFFTSVIVLGHPPLLLHAPPSPLSRISRQQDFTASAP